MKRLRPRRLPPPSPCSPSPSPLAACGAKSEEGGSEKQPFSLTLDFYPNPDHAGIYMAQRLGYFEEAGLELAIHTPSDPAAPIRQVAAGRTDLAISYEPEVVLATEQGLDVVAVGTIVDRPLTSMIWLKKSKIRGIADLRGKTIATAGIPYQDAYLKTILARVGLTPSDVRTVNVGYGLLPAIVGGRAAGDARRLPQRRGSRPAPAGQATRSSSRSTSSASPPTTSWCSSPGAVELEEDSGSDPPLPRGARPRHGGREEEPGSDDEGAARSQSGPRPEADPSRGESDAAAALGQRQDGPGEVEPLRRLDARKRADLGAAATPAELLSNAYLPGSIPE